MQQLQEEATGLEEMLSLRNEEVGGLKQHLQTFSTECKGLKMLVAALQK
jgi:regulator of replication initiation timing